ncbi:tRNA (adenine(22)-N(1))-methyltransferase [Peribacillus frigoritolerans]|uniref:tRNA (adenine(22)-N(1))-methyltransferase n=1 Tax=Peribacillus frigoritolerans TaxID=450367 RepID=UPI00105A80BD|nr:tRNA (adenine(22)-N(1))-methyltransferase TrmK [Peribacillus frigoritolerans]TDL82269.1 tRNA (adenine-N(1))-methyltransferase [Peribacillus frigoritolerans]
MNEVNLSNRLKTVADYIPKNAVLADIGSDHAYLPCYALLNGLAASAVAGEVVQGPFQSAKKQVQKSGLEDVISVRLGSGLDVIDPNEVTCITIAGMGGALIEKILEAGKEKLAGVERLILQPNIHAHHVRKWLLGNGWELINEEILEEDGKIYEILIAEKGEAKAPYQHTALQKGLLVGPFLMEEKTEPFLKKWAQEIEHNRRILTSIESAALSPGNEAKKKELNDLIEMLEEVTRK